MHVIAGDRRARRGSAGLFEAQLLDRGENGLNIEQGEPLALAGRALNTVRIGNHPSQHLVAAAQSEHGTAGAGMGGDIDIPAFGAQCREIGPRRLGAG